MPNRFVAIVAALTIVFAASPLSARTIFPAFGGQGDKAFDDHCPAHQFLIGLAGEAGLWTDRVGIICAPILANGTHGTKYYGPTHGGGGGTAVEISCPADSVVYGATVALNEVSQPRVSLVILNCGSMQADRQSTVTFEGSGNADGAPHGIVFRDQRCPTGELGSGFNGHFGKDVNALGLDCAVRTRS